MLITIIASVIAVLWVIYLAFYVLMIQHIKQGD